MTESNRYCNFNGWAPHFIEHIIAATHALLTPLKWTPWWHTPYGDQLRVIFKAAVLARKASPEFYHSATDECMFDDPKEPDHAAD